MIAHEPSQKELDNIIELWPDADLSIIKAIYYFDGWSDYEEDGGILVFQGIDDSIQIAEYGHCVMSSDNNHFDIDDINEGVALERIKEIELLIGE